jgi:hypothetical protein
MGLAVVVVVTGLDAGVVAGTVEHSVARQWNEQLLDAIRRDYARPTIHARNLYHVSVAMWDAWAAYSVNAEQVIANEQAVAGTDKEAAREEAISFAAYRIMQARYAKSPGAVETMAAIDGLMDALGYDRNFNSTVGPTPAAVGNRIAVAVLFAGLNDGANEQGGYENLYYEPVNPPLLPDFPGNPDILDPNRWQPLALDFFIDQSGNVVVGGYPDFLSPEWGIVTPFALAPEDLTIYNRDNFDYWIYHDPGPPPEIGQASPTDVDYKWGFELVSIWSSHCDPTDGVMWDISPASIGNATLPTDPSQYPAFYDTINGGDGSPGYALNPVTGQPYDPQIVPRGDYVRILAEFWADGPESETPPGHWFTLLNYVSDHPDTVKRLEGTGPPLGDLEWDVKSYLAMGGAMHDAAIAAWGVKGWYDFIRPVSALRYMADNGQCSDSNGPSYDVNGLNLEPGYIEVVTDESSSPGERHEHLRGKNDDNLGKIAIYAWRGPDYINDPDTDAAGVGWILAENWWPYQRPSFVTPPFAGYVSGHSTYSRAAAELMTLLTGSPWFPGGMGTFDCLQNEYLVFEEGPSVNVQLQWASYYDASDQCSLSRIWGGIHPPADDIPGRFMGEVIGPDAWNAALVYFEGSGYPACPLDYDGSNQVDVGDLLTMLGAWGSSDPTYDIAPDGGDGIVDLQDLLELLSQFGACPN